MVAVAASYWFQVLEVATVLVVCAVVVFAVAVVVVRLASGRR